MNANGYSLDLGGDVSVIETRIDDFSGSRMIGYICSATGCDGVLLGYAKFDGDDVTFVDEHRRTVHHEE